MMPSKPAAVWGGSMANLQLSLAITNNPRTRPIIDGRVKPAGIDFLKTVLGPAEMFWRQLSFAEFDVSEMSMSELMMIRARGDDRFVGVPVFTPGTSTTPACSF